jgi:hypothetical protein
LVQDVEAIQQDAIGLAENAERSRVRAAEIRAKAVRSR